MATFTAPKVWGTEILLPADLNALVAAIAASLNSIVNAQVAADAAISGSKIASAPDGIPYGKLAADLSITHDQLAVGAADVGVTSDESGSASEQTANPGPTTVATVQRTVLGGTVLLLGTCTVTIDHQDLSPTETVVAARIKRGVTALSVDVEVAGKAAAANRQPVSFSVFYVDTAQTGLKTWTLEVQRISGTAEITITDWQLFAWELK